MATPTYDLIEEQVLGSAQATVTFGTGGTLTQAYKDVIIECDLIASGASVLPMVRFNGDSGTNYSVTLIEGANGTAYSFRDSNYSGIRVGFYDRSVPTTYPADMIVHVMSYANASVYKTVLARGNRIYPETPGDGGVVADAGLWRNTAAITSITVAATANSFASGSILRLWGVKG